MVSRMGVGPVRHQASREGLVEHAGFAWPMDGKHIARPRDPADRSVLQYTNRRRPRQALVARWQRVVCCRLTFAAHLRSDPRARRTLAALDGSTVVVLDALPDRPIASQAAVTFGNFDGVHLGHRALLAVVRQAADRLGGPACVVTFDPHPLVLLRPDRAPQAVDTLQGRLEQLQLAGVDVAVVLRFDAALASQSAHWFAETALFDRLAARAVIVGPDTRFGQGGSGDIALLQSLGRAHGATVTTCPGALYDNAIVSSSRVRHTVAAGDMALAAALLGRPFSLQGPVVQGDQRGRLIGFPTANVDAPSQQRPASGVYACRIALPDGRLLPAVTNCGTRPTFAGARWQVEAHVFDFTEDLYGQTVRLHFVQRLRGEQKFDGLPALQAQITQDMAAARAILA